MALLIVNVAIFGQSIGFDFIPFDDPAYVTDNGYINKGLNWEGIRWALWYGEGGQSLNHTGVVNLWHPLTWISHMLDVSLFGTESARGHHLTNVILHGGAAILLMLVAFRLSGSIPAAFVIALLWMVHPLKAESVSWVSERKDLLSGFFFWGSLACALQAHRSPKRPWRQIAWGLFLLASLSKPSVVVLPALLILLEGVIQREKTWGWKFCLNSAQKYKWWFLTSIVISVITVLMQSQGSHRYFMEQSTLSQRMAGQAWAMGFYLWRFLVPWNLSFDYPQPQLPTAYFAAAWLLLIAFLGAVIWKRQKYPRLFFAVGWWFLCLLPVSGLVYVGASFTSDRYLYLAIAGPLLAFLPTLSKGINEIRRPVLMIPLLVALVWSGLSWAQTSVWKNGWSLFEHATKAQPRSSLGWSNLGSLYQQSGNLSQANKHLQMAVSLEPNDYIAWYNLANNQKKLGDPQSALDSFTMSLQGHPEYLPSLKNSGLLLVDLGRIPEAGARYKTGCEITQYQDPVFLWLLCETELAQSHYDSAAAILNQLDALQINDPNILSGMQKARAFLQRPNKS